MLQDIPYLKEQGLIWLLNVIGTQNIFLLILVKKFVNTINK